MRKAIFIITFLLTYTFAYAQDYKQTDSISSNIPSSTNNTKNTENYTQIQRYERIEILLNQRKIESFNNLLIAKDKKMSSIESKTATYNDLSSNFNYSFGEYKQNGIQLSLNPIDRLTVNMGASILNYNIVNTNYADIVYNMDINYDLFNWLSLIAYGQYSVNSLYNARKGGYMLSPQSLYGAGINIKASDNFSVDLVREQTFNPVIKKWGGSGYFSPRIKFR